MFQDLDSSFRGHSFYVRPSYLQYIQPPLNIKSPSSKNKVTILLMNSRSNKMVTLLIENINYCMTLTSVWTST